MGEREQWEAVCTWDLHFHISTKILLREKACACTMGASLTPVQLPLEASEHQQMLMHCGEGALSISVRGWRARQLLELKLPQLLMDPGLKMRNPGKYLREEAAFMSMRNNAMSLFIAD